MCRDTLALIKYSSEQLPVSILIEFSRIDFTLHSLVLCIPPPMLNR